MTLNEYDKLLRGHDWYYNYSDDGRVWRAGESVQSQIVSLSKMSEDHLTLYNAWSKYYFSGPNFNSEKFTKEQLDEVRKTLGVL